MNQKEVACFHKIISTGFGSGYCPVAPGTAGAILATAIWCLLAFCLPTPTLRLSTFILTLVFTLLGIYSSGKVEQCWGHDPKRVVVDEMVGVWIPLIVCPNAEAARWFWYMLASLVLFRFFDILKPLGIHQMEKLPGGVGIMMDDVLSGIYSLILVGTALYFWG